MRARLLIWCCGMMLAAAGCKVGPDYMTPSAPVAERWTVQYPPTLGEGEPVDALWWNSFQDPVLTDLVERVRYQNLSLQEANARIVEARARLGISRGSLWPEVFQTDSFTHQRFSENGTPFGGATGFNIPPFDLWSTGFDAAWEIDVAGRLRRGVEASAADFDASIENRNDVMVTLFGDVARAYVELRTAQERIRVAQKNRDQQRPLVKIFEIRKNQGADSGLLNSSRFNALLHQTEAAIPEMEILAKVAENRICVLMGEPPRVLEADLQGSKKNIPTPSPTIAVGMPIDLLRRRADVRRAERELAAQSARIGVATADFYPQVSLTGTFSLVANNFEDVFQWDSLQYSTGPGVRWNVLNFGRIRNNVIAQEALYEQLLARYRESVILAGEEVENALATFVLERERESYLAKATAESAEAVRLFRDRVEGDLPDEINLLEAVRTQALVDDAYVVTRGRVTLAAVALYKALGGGWEIQPQLIMEGTELILPGEVTEPLPGTAPTPPEVLPAPAPGIGPPLNPPAVDQPGEPIRPPVVQP
jgi:NodT family efflux transporter outer membrane factor (OMF) lipoprotein